jgi:hypothetical protein
MAVRNGLFLRIDFQMGIKASGSVPLGSRFFAQPCQRFIEAWLAEGVGDAIVGKRGLLSYLFLALATDDSHDLSTSSVVGALWRIQAKPMGQDATGSSQRMISSCVSGKQRTTAPVADSMSLYFCPQLHCPQNSLQNSTISLSLRTVAIGSPHREHLILSIGHSRERVFIHQ